MFQEVPKNELTAHGRYQPGNHSSKCRTKPKLHTFNTIPGTGFNGNPKLKIPQVLRNLKPGYTN